MLPPALLAHFEKVLKSKIAATVRVAGGDINRAFRLTTTNGRTFFLKTNDAPQAGEMLRAEHLGLGLLGASGVIAVPKVLAQGVLQVSAALPEGGSVPLSSEAFLLMEFVPTGQRNRLFWENFGTALANLHGNSSEWFGFSHANFIGSLPQSNKRHDDWAEFYAEERLLPQMLLAMDAGKLDGTDARLLENVCRKIGILCPEESPALTHGDLWAGNFLCRADGQPVLIDPAASFAHREMDLAMSRLFGGFDEAFYRSYEAAWPLAPGFERRMEIYQLYYLLAHVNLFGGSYVAQAREMLRRWG